MINKTNTSSKKKIFHKNKANKVNKVNNIDPGKILIYGNHPVKMALLNKRRIIFKIFITQNNKKELDEFILNNKLNIKKELINIVNNDDILAKFSSKIVHQGFVILCSTLNFTNDHDFIAKISKKDKNELKNIIILDQLTDLHNIGAIIRSSIAFNVDDIIIPKQNFHGENATICKSSSGAIEKANIILSGNINNLIVKLKDLGYWIAGLDGSGQDNFPKLHNYNPICLVIGNEGSGIRHLVKKNCDLLLKISISDKVESLNASNAAAIALWEINNN